MTAVPASVRMEEHPLLRVACFLTRYPTPLGEMETPEPVRTLLSVDAEAPIARDEGARAAIRDLLRLGGYKPTGRGKPASEYLTRAAGEGSLEPINLAVHACNAVSLHSGLPISVVDLQLATPPFRIALAPPGSAYVFNRTGQEIDLGGLLCLFDEGGPCANPVRDSQRTKTSADTTLTLSVLWSAVELVDRLHAAERWYRSLLESAGAETTEVEVAFGVGG